MKEVRPSTYIKKIYHYRDAATVPAEMRERVLKWATQAAKVSELAIPRIVFVETTTEYEAQYRFDRLITIHGTRRREAHSKIDRDFTIYVNTECLVPEILVGIDDLMRQAGKEPRADRARDISGSRFKQR